jgi:hypothetical protein
MSGYKPNIFLSIGTQLYLDSFDKKYIDDMLEETSCKIEEYVIKIEEHKKHLEYIKSKKYEIEEKIRENDIIALENKIDSIHNIYQEYIIYYDIINNYIE